MADTFMRKFGGWLNAEARRWRNPDGSEGGIVAVGATVDPTAIVSAGCEVFPRANIGDGASIGYGASVGPGASIGDGASIGYGANIGPRANIGYGANIGRRASIGPRASIGDGASIGPGASIGDGANIGDGASIGPGASIGDGASIGPRASIGDGAKYSAEDWLFVLGPQGSRAAWLTAVWSPAHGLRFWTGCKRELTADEALAAITAAHGASHMGDDYRYAVQCVVNHPGLARAMAKAAAE